MSHIKYILKRKFLTVFITLIALPLFSQNFGRHINPSYHYYANPGYINITQITSGLGLGDRASTNSDKYFGITNLFGYQFDRNIMGGIGIGYFHFDDMGYIPLYLDFRYMVYLKSFTPYLSCSSGLMIDYTNINHGTKIFLNPVVGISRLVSKSIELTMGTGVMVQMGDELTRTSFVNVKIGVTFRENQYRLYKPGRKYF